MSAAEYHVARIIGDLRQHAESYRRDARKFRHDPEAATAVEGVGRFTAIQWALIYEQTARELDHIADKEQT